MAQERTWREIALEYSKICGCAAHPVSINTAAECDADFGRLGEEAKAKEKEENEDKRD